MSSEYKEGYYYLHTNGSLIWKNSIVVESDPLYFVSTFVVKYWKIDNNDEYNLMLEEIKDIKSEKQNKEY